MNLIKKAFEFASKIHTNEFRRDGITPYITHVQKVADIAASRWGGEDIITVAFCHDCLESGATLEELENDEFSEELVKAVQLLTLDKNIPYHENIQKIKDSGNLLAIRVKIADNLANLADSPTDKQILKYAKSLQILLS